jgi:putative acetyltransferase
MILQKKFEVKVEDMRMVNKNITIRPEEHKDYKSIISLILRSFQEGTDYSDGTDIIALVEEIRDSKFYIPELSFVAERNNKVVGHFLFSKFPLSPTKEGGYVNEEHSEIVMLAPVSVHADYFRQGIGTAMINMGIEKVRELGYKGITVEGNYNFYNRLGFRTSSEYNIFPTSGYPMEEPRCMMCQETYEGSLDGIHGYIVYDMYFNA